MDYQIFIWILEMCVLILLPGQVKTERRNVALNKTVIPSSEAGGSWQDFSSIVDGNLSRDATECKCCAAILYSTNNPWVMVDLGQYYWIDGVTLYGRTDKLDIGTECKYGYYGPSCSQSCGHCNNGDPCDDVTGECSNCAAGYRGTQCYDVCTDGSYGSNCVDVCGECFNGEPCDKIDGTCVHCDPGYQGKLCDTECSRRTYGQNCSEVCGFCHENAHCNHVTGRCVGGCVAGRRGSLCKQECETNSFGENCLYTCHCKDGVSCDSVTGSCEDGACADGFSGLGCQQSLPEKDNSQSQPNNPISLPISVGVGVFLICTTVGLVVYVVYLKRRITRAETPNAGSNGTDTQPYDDLQY